MKIAQVVCRFKPYKGGISNVAYEYSLGLAKLGHQVTVFTPLFDPKDNEVKFDQFEVRRLKPFFRWGNSGFLPQLYRELKAFDIVNLHYPFFGGAEIVWLLKRKLGHKMKLVVNYQMDVVGKGWEKCIFDFHTRFIMPKIIARADKIIVSSLDYARHSDIKDLLTRWPDKFSVIPPGVDVEHFSPQAKDQNLQNKFRLKNEDKVLLLVGGLDRAHYFKGIDFLIGSYNDIGLADLKIIIVGDGDLKPEYQKHVLEAGLLDNIFFAGSAGDRELVKYYNLADAVILPSIDKSEAFGIVLIEAMACGKPVIAADLPGVRSVFRDNETGLSFEVLNRSDLVSKVRRMFADNEFRLALGQAAREQAVRDYSQDDLIKKLEKLYALL